MGMTATDRQARLRPEGAEHYPTFPVRVWTSAACMAELATSCRGILPERAEHHVQERVLSVADFQFRGGCPGWSRGWCARTRLGEPAFST